MSIPGLGQAVQKTSISAPTLSSTVSTHNIPANSEWRFEVAFGESIEVRVLTGTAELFGTELALNHTYTFRACKAAIYTWHGTMLSVTGHCSSEYTAQETPMVSYINTHFALEGLRDAAAAEGGNKQSGSGTVAEVGNGPRVLIVGPNNAGKTSLVKTLTAYALRQGRQPIVVNTDSREGILSIPGSLTATPFASIIDVEQGWGSSATSTSTPVPVKLPLCYYYGLANPEENVQLYKPIITRLALATRGRMGDDTWAGEGGLIIDTPGVVAAGRNGYELISHMVEEFSVNVILILGSERLHSDLSKRFSQYTQTHNQPIQIVKLDKSGGCVDRDEHFLQQAREAAIKEYFFGDARTTLSPHMQVLSFDDVVIYKIREDEEEKASSTDLYTPTTPTPEMAHCILALTHASPSDGQDGVRDASVMGFVYVADVDEKKRRVRVLAPVMGKIGAGGGGVGVLVWGSWPGTALGLMG